MNASTTMNAVGYTTPGAPDVLIPMQVPRPRPLPTEILVKVQASSINPVDWRTRAGAPTPAAASQGNAPHVLGWDVSGVVEEVGAGVHLFQVGDEVIGLPMFPRPAGANSEFVTAPSRQFAHKPKSIDHIHAAAIPLAGLTAWQALREVANIAPRQRILIHAASGGVGHLAVQVAKALGGYVIATASSSQHAWLKELGADEVIDYRAENFEDVVDKIDAAIDLVGAMGDGGSTQIRSLKVIRAGGILVRVAPGMAEGLLEAAAKAGVRVSPEILVEPDGRALSRLAHLVDTGALKPHVAATYPLRDLAEAHARGEQGGFSGKIVIVP